MNNVPDDAVTLRVFPFSLKDRAWNWLDSLPSGSITTWDQLVEKFLGKYFPPSKTGQLRNEITNFRQYEGESLYEAWERMKDLLRKCPHHGLSDPVILQTFYQGTSNTTKYHLDAAAGGSLMNLSYQRAYEKIEDMANNISHHYGGDRTIAPKRPAGVLEVDANSAYMARIEASLGEMTKQLKAIQLGATAQACQVGAMPMTPQYGGQFSEGSVGYEAVNYMGAAPYNNPYSNSYNPGWRNHPNFRWGTGLQATPSFQNQQGNSEKNSSVESLLEKYIKVQDITNQQQQAAIKNLEVQIGQLAQQLANRPQGTLPGRTENNPKGESMEHCKAVHLRSGRTLPEVAANETPQPEESHEVNGEEGEKSKETNNQEERGQSKTPYWSVMKPDLPFPNRLRKSRGGTRPDEPVEKKGEELATKNEKKKKLDNQFEKFLDIFKKLQINLPFAEALSQMPTYLKFMKEILTKKRKLSDYETIALTENCSAILSNNLPKKCKDPGSFNLPFTLGNFYSGMALCDLGASINLMSLSLCQKLGLCDPSFFKLRGTEIKLKMADQSIKSPVGVLEDVLVKVGKFILPADFIVLDMEDDSEDSVIFGRSFLATARAKIDVEKGELTMRVQGEKEKFNVLQKLEPSFEPVECMVISTVKKAQLQGKPKKKVKKRKRPRLHGWSWKEKEVICENKNGSDSKRRQRKKFVNVLERYLDCW